MSTWIERNLLELAQWRSSSQPVPNDNELMYLLNDIGPLHYVFKDVEKEIAIS